MKLPRKNKQWAKEAARALDLAWKLAELECDELDQLAKERLYKFGPMLCAKNRRISDKNQIKSISEYAIRERLNDFHIDADSINNYSINFFLAYLDSHVALEIIAEHKVHEIMEYIVENIRISE